MIKAAVYKDFYTYSLMKTFYSKKKSYLDTFFPFVLFSMPQKWGIWVENLLNEIKNKYSLNIPILTIKEILKSLKKRWNIEYWDDFRNIILTQEWKILKLDWITDNQIVYWELDTFFENIRKFIKKETWILHKNDYIYENVEKIINNNFLNFFEYFNPVIETEDITISNWIDNLFKKLLSEYIILELTNKWQNYNIIKKIVYWSLLSSVLTKENFIKDLNNNYHLSNLTIYLDSNIVFSLLWWHWKKTENAIKQLIKLIVDNWIKIKIFDFTVDEIINVLEYYSEEKYKYFTWWNIDSIYQNFKNIGYTDTDIYKLIAEIEIKLSNEFGISIDNFNLSNISKIDKDYDIDEFSDKAEYSKKHDINSIEAIKYYRWKSTPRILELSKYIFLSADRKLFYADLKINDKFLSKKIPNIILPELLSNFLWLKKPDWNSNIPINVIFSSLESYWLIDKDVWNRFYSISYDMIDNKEINEEDFALLVSSNEFKEELIWIKDENKINKKIIKVNIKRENKNSESKSYNKVLKQVKKTHKENIGIERENQKVEDKNSILIKIKGRGRKKAKIWSIIISIILIIFFISISYVIYNRLNFIFNENWWDYEWTFYFIGITFTIILSIFWLPKFKLSNRINTFIYKILVNKDIKDLL